MSETIPEQTCRRKPWQARVSDLLAERNVSSKKSVAYGPHQRHLLDIYKPKSAGTNTPIAVFAYGGAWRTGERACYSFVGAALASKGITAVIPDYRLYPEARFPHFNSDIAAAYAWTRRNLDPTGTRAIVLIGHSAGAHIATSITYDPGYLTDIALPPDGVIAMSGPYAFDPTTWPTTKDIFESAPDANAPRPVFHVGPHCPPTLLIYGLKDDVVEPENARELHAALRAAGVSSRLIEYPNIGHIQPITSFLRFLRWRAPILKECVGFVNDLARRRGELRTAAPAASA